MEVEDVEVVRMELKYCERCGGLWLRARGDAGVYCKVCGEVTEAIEEGWLAKERPRQSRPKVVLKGENGEVLLVCSEGGIA